MVTVLSLWLPILLAAVAVFIVSSVIHMVLTYHRSDFRGVPNETAVMDALRPFNIPPGEYVLPWADTPAARQSPEFLDKASRGPVAFVTALPPGIPGMGASLAQWFGYCVLVGIFAAYVASRTLLPGEDYLQVFRITGTVAFAGYGLALIQNSIWYKRAWSTTAKSVFDALLYGFFTGGVFGWLWP